ncbi:MAG: nickel-dependent hydrogenase large subunit [Coriobacteriia bacterium]|jgi:ech hydrogenase subunit E|nr:nickel-dependent hydrogenase large subunit [Coriobacteriia bacterium]MDR2714393.1 nickel-dependent hydrogenase large subunit [Coriobacteriales bacterium]
MGKRTVIPFGPQHPVLPEPIHLDLVIEDEKVIEAIPQIGFIHRGLEKLVETRDYQTYVNITERICGICSFGHSLGFSQTIEILMGIEIPKRAEFLRVIWHELSRIHSHLLWLGLLADAFGYENLFMQCWRLRERVLNIFEQTTGGRVILSACNVGGVLQDISDEDLRGIVQILDGLRDEYGDLLDTFLYDRSVESRLGGVGYLSKQQAEEFAIVGPFARASGVIEDVRMFGHGGYGALEDFEPVISTRGDGYARCEVRALEVLQSIDIIKELVGKMPDTPISVAVKGSPEAGSRSASRVEQPRGECYYYSRGNGTKFLDRFRIRTPTAQNVAGMVATLQGCDLADVPLNVLTIDPCISCTER